MVEFLRHTELAVESIKFCKNSIPGKGVLRIHLGLRIVVKFLE